MYCTKCGAENPDKSVFCNQCGIKIQQYSTSFQQPGMQQKDQHQRKTVLIIAIAIAVITVGIAMMLLLTKQATDSSESDPAASKEIRVINE